MIKGGTNSSALTRPYGLQVGQTAYGKTVRLIYGTVMSGVDLVWYEDWKSTGSPVNPALWLVVGGGPGGKKSGKSSKKGNLKYFSAAINLLIGHAPIRTILSAWYNNQKLAVVRCGASGIVTNGQFTFTPAIGDSIVGVTETLPSTGPYVVAVPNFIADVNNVTANGVNLQSAVYPPGAGQYSVDDAGNYSFNGAQAGATVIINYRKLGGGSGSGTLAGILGVTVYENFSRTFNDYGNPNVVTQSGTWERPLWNTRWPVPGRLDPGAYTARDPYSFWWDAVNPTFYFPPQLEGKRVTVYYGVPAIFKSDGNPAATTDTPLQLLNLEFEHAFASGSEYVNHPEQQLIQDWVAGLGSVDFDFGPADSMPNLQFEVVGMFAQWPNGDCDPADVITDILASGPVLVAENTTKPNWPIAPAPSGSGTGTVNGVIIDAGSRVPIAGATVSYSGGSTTTAADGSFSFVGVSVGSYTFTVSASGYKPYTQSVAVYSGGTSLFDAAIPPTSSGSSMLFGQGINETSDSAAFPQAIDSLRIWDSGCRWALLEPSSGTYNWTPLDNLIAEAQAKGITDFLYCFGSTPAWTAISTSGVAGAYDATSNRPPNLSDYTAFVTAIVTRYHSVIRNWEVWNEVNNPPFWIGTNAQMVAMAQAAYNAIKAVDPGATVTYPNVCNVGSGPASALDALLTAGVGPYGDVVSFHGYLADGAAATGVTSLITALRATMATHSISSAPIWDTESGFKANALIADADKPGWVTDWVTSRINAGLARSYWYQWDNQTQGTMFNTSTNTLLPWGQTWISLYNNSRGGSSGGSTGPWVEVDNLQSLSGWLQPGNKGNTGGGSQQAHGSWTMTPNLDGTETFAITPASPYDDYYFYLHVPGYPTVAPQKLKYHVEFNFPTSTDLSRSEAFEFECQLSDGIYTYNMAWQADVGGSGNWRYFHFVGAPGGKWIDTGIPVVITAGTPTIVDALFLLNAASGKVTHQSLLVDGVQHVLGVTQDAVLERQSHYLSAAVQLDTKKNFLPYSVKVRNNVLWLP